MFLLPCAHGDPSGILLDLGDQIALGRVGEGMTRRHLTHGAWLDVRPGWLTAGDRLLEDLVHEVPWQAERRQMYDSVVDVPRLTRFYAEGEPLPGRSSRRPGTPCRPITPVNSVSPSRRPACASIATGETPWPGTEIGSDARASRTR